MILLMMVREQKELLHAVVSSKSTDADLLESHSLPPGVEDRQTLVIQVLFRDFDISATGCSAPALRCRLLLPVPRTCKPCSTLESQIMHMPHVSQRETDSQPGSRCESVGHLRE